jgi:hypothetical protein
MDELKISTLESGSTEPVAPVSPAPEISLESPAIPGIISLDSTPVVQPAPVVATPEVSAPQVVTETVAAEVAKVTKPTSHSNKPVLIGVGVIALALLIGAASYFGKGYLYKGSGTCADSPILSAGSLFQRSNWYFSKSTWNMCGNSITQQS